MSARTSCGFRPRRGLIDGKLTPRPFVLRVYAAATPDGWKVMPGGFARVSDKPDARAVSMGGRRRIRRRLGARPTSRSSRRACCRRRRRCASCACSAICRAARPTICSGSAAIWSARRRRCGWCAASARARSIRIRRWAASASRWSGCARLLVAWGALDPKTNGGAADRMGGSRAARPRTIRLRARHRRAPRVSRPRSSASA